ARAQSVEDERRDDVERYRTSSVPMPVAPHSMRGPGCRPRRGKFMAHSMQYPSIARSIRARPAMNPGERMPTIRAEAHFGRVMSCYAERPAHMGAVLAEAVVRVPNRVALVDGERRMT